MARCSNECKGGKSKVPFTEEQALEFAESVKKCRKVLLTDKERSEAFKTKDEFMGNYEKNPRPKRK